MEWPAPPSGVIGSPANQEEEGMDMSVLDIDLGKNVRSVVGQDASGAVVMRRKVRRETLLLWRRLPEAYSSALVGRVVSGFGLWRQREKFVLSSVWTPEAQAGKAQNPLEMGEQHLDFLPPATDLHVFRRCGVRTSHVAGVFLNGKLWITALFTESDRSTTH